MNPLSPESSGFFLRRMSRQDLPALSILLSAAFSAPRLGEEIRRRLEIYCDRGLDHLPLEDQTGEELPREYWTLIQSRGGEGERVAGICGLYRLGTWTWPGSFWLGWLAVDPADQGKGLGRRMLHLLMQIARAKGCEVLKVETDRGGAAVGFYERLGWRKEGILSHHYGSGADAVVLTRDLSDIHPLEAPEISGSS